ncbi:MAG: RDD family protein [Gammaproteobacteria bacterium]|nr:RDD family protein [Gammaproteobacteria bacterium]
MSRHQLDTIHLVETPEGIDLQAELAGPVSRGLAYSIDIIIRGIVLGVLSIILLTGGKAGYGIILILTFLMEWFYPVLFEVYYNGQTIGKKYMGLYVVNDDLTPICWGSSLTRNLLRFIDFFPFAYLSGLLSMILSKRFQRLGDISAGSLVVYKQNKKQDASLPVCESYPPPVPLTVDDQIAIIGFTERHNDLSQDRQQELANILSGITNKKHSNNIEYLRGVGNWLLGVK